MALLCRPLLLPLLLSAMALAAKPHPRWEEFKALNGRTYSSPAEELRRAAIFADNMRLIDEHNERFQRGETSYELGMNGFADQDDEDDDPAISDSSDRSKRSAEFDDKGYTYDGDFSKLAKHVDWRDKNVISPAKMQGECGACYAFAGLGAMEAHLAIKTGVQYDLSEQQILECTHNHTYDGRPTGNYGCKGGEYWWTYTDIQLEGGIVTEDDYPFQHLWYRNRQNMPPMAKCHVDKSKMVATTTGIRRIRPGKVELMMAAVQHEGPLVVTLNSISAKDIKKLRGFGIYDNAACTNEKRTHMVVIVGYGMDAATGVDYWIIKNSWGFPGQDWGEKGFARIRRGVNRCGIEDMPSFPLVRKL